MSSRKKDSKLYKYKNILFSQILNDTAFPIENHKIKIYFYQNVRQRQFKDSMIIRQALDKAFELA